MWLPLRGVARYHGDRGCWITDRCYGRAHVASLGVFVFNVPFGRRCPPQNAAIRYTAEASQTMKRRQFNLPPHMGRKFAGRVAAVCVGTAISIFAYSRVENFGPQNMVQMRAGDIHRHDFVHGAGLAIALRRTFHRQLVRLSNVWRSWGDAGSDRDVEQGARCGIGASATHARPSRAVRAIPGER